MWVGEGSSWSGDLTHGAGKSGASGFGESSREGGVLRTTSGGERGFSALWPCERSKPGRASGVLVGVPGVLAVLRVQSLGGDAYRMRRSGPSTQ